MTRTATLNRLDFIVAYYLGLLDLFLQYLTRTENGPTMSIFSYKAEFLDSAGIDTKVVIKPSGWHEETEQIIFRVTGYDIVRIGISSPKLVPFVGTDCLSFKSESILCRLMLRLRTPIDDKRILTAIKKAARLTSRNAGITNED